MLLTKPKYDWIPPTYFYFQIISLWGFFRGLELNTSPELGKYMQSFLLSFSSEC